jgi:hypothetical protein
MTKYLLPVALYLLCAANTDCSGFRTVTVPADDASEPTPFAGRWENGAYTESTFGPTPLNVVWGPGDTPPLIVSAALDGGGLRDLHTESWIENECCEEGRGCATYTIHRPTIVASQPGGIGAPVSNGLYSVIALDVPASICADGRGLWMSTLRWRTTAYDFHGNRVVGPTNRAGYWLFNKT